MYCGVRCKGNEILVACAQRRLGSTHEAILHITVVKLVHISVLYIARPSAVTHTRHCLKRPSSYLCRIARPSAVTQSGTGDVRMYVARPTHPHTIFATGTKNPFTENTLFRISAVKSIAPRHGSLFCSFKKRPISQTNKSNTKPFFFFLPSNTTCCGHVSKDRPWIAAKKLNANTV